MSIVHPEFEYVDQTSESIRYLEHGWPTELCRWHSHAVYELHLIVATRGKAFVGDYIGEFGPGCLFLTGPNLPHNWITDELIHPDPIDVRDMVVQFSHESIQHLSAAFPEFSELNQMFERAKSGIEFSGFDPSLAEQSLANVRDSKGGERIMAFLSFLLKLNKHDSQKLLSIVTITQSDGSSRQTRIAEVVNHMTNYFHQDFSLEEAARIAGMTTSTFSRNFQRITGNKFVEFGNRVRISQACSMLYGTDEQISTICYEVGFKNIAHFNRQFLKMKAMTPTAYRELAQNELSPHQGARL